MVSGVRKPKAPGIADVQRDDLVALALELLGATSEPAADLVLDVAQAFAGTNLGFLGHAATVKIKTGGRRITRTRRPAQPGVPEFRRSVRESRATAGRPPGAIPRRLPALDCGPRTWASAAGQRVWKWQPVGRSTAEGSFALHRQCSPGARVHAPDRAAAPTLTTCACTDGAAPRNTSSVGALLDHAPEVHHQHAFAELAHHGEVVAHEKDAGAVLALDRREAARASAPGSTRRAR